MAWYWWTLIIVGVIIFITSLVNRKGRERRRQLFLEDISTWQVGDKLITKHPYVQ